MNKSLISVLTIGTFFVSGAFAEDVVIDTPNAWNYSNIFTTEADYNMYYTGAESQPVKFGALNSDKNYVLKSLTLKPAGTSISGQSSTNPSIWYAASNYTFNVDAVSGEDVVFSNETTAAFQHLVGTSMTIQKAEGNEDSTAVAVINGGNAQFNIDVGGGSAPASLYVLANTNFKTNLGTKTASVIGGGSTITVGNNSTFTTNGVMYYKDGTDTKKSGLVVDEGSIYTANNQTIFGTYTPVI